jgi:hypothetical protein
MRVQKKVCSLLILFAVMLCFVAPSQLLAEDEIGQWINHLGFIPGDSNVAVQFNTVSVRGGGLEITAAATGESFVQQGLQVPPGYLVNGVRVCYAQTGRSHINQVSLLQLQDPPIGVETLLNDETTFNNSDPGPVCVNTAPQRVPIDPSLGALSMRLGMVFANDTDSIVILGIGLLTVPDPNSPVAELEDEVAQLNSNQERIINVLKEHDMELDTLDRDLDRLTDAVIKHTHIYRTGKGVGHNNVEAASSTFTFETETPGPKPEPSVVKKKKK